MFKKTFYAFLFIFSLTVHLNEVYASGVFLIEQSVSGMGYAYAGGAAFSEDASTIFFNPAGMSKFCRTESVAGFHIVMPGNHFTDRGSVITSSVPSTYETVFTNPGTNVPIGGGGPISGTNGKQIGETAVVPNFYFLHPIDNCWTVGVGVFSPFGLASDYGNDWTGRYHAVRSALMTLNINPCVSYKVNNCFSVGIGLNVMYLHAKISNSVDYGTIAWLSAATLSEPTQSAVKDGLALSNFIPQAQDGKVRIKGQSWGYGVNFGFLWQPCCGTRVGFHYRSAVKQCFEGTEQFTQLPQFIQSPSSAGSLESFFTSLAAATAQNTKTRSGVTLPETLSFSGYYELNPCWAVMGDLTWTRWSRIDELRFRFSSSQSDQVTTTRWNNTVRVSLGAIYRPDDCWIYRFGVAYDESPIPNDALFTVRIPDNDRYWLALGLGYRWNQCLRLDIGYAHLFVPNAAVDKTGFEFSEDLIRGGLKGGYKGRVDILSAQMVYRF